MLRSDDNLWENTLEFIRVKKKLTVFSAYVTLRQLKKLNEFKNISQLIVRWDSDDLVSGFADLAIYDYCVENEITLFRNERIHLKAIWNNEDEVLFGSANITGKGIGETNEFNFELNDVNEEVGFEDQRYFNRIIKDSDLVDEENFNTLKDYVENNKVVRPKNPKLQLSSPKNSAFLLSQLPMSETPLIFFDIISGHKKNCTNEELACAAHDSALYSMDAKLNITDFFEELETVFTAHAFIISFKEAVKNSEDQSMRYGAAVNWIIQNTTTVPTPISWDLKKEQIVNRLYDWVCEFDEDFTWSVPGARSQVIFFDPNARPPL